MSSDSQRKAHHHAMSASTGNANIDPYTNRVKRLPKSISMALAASFAAPCVIHAQELAPEMEEVVVTGSFITNSAFSQDSPVDTITAQDLVEAGAPDMASYIRDLTYTQDTDVMNNVLGPGSQSGSGGSFNLRGLGNNSTLTMVGGMRLLDDRLNRNLPQIAIQRMEVVLDGGSALYGSDAVAGVVNIIPVKEFDGFLARSYYQSTKDNAMENFNNSMMWGKTFDNGVRYVGALEYQKQTPLMMYERPREMSVSATTAPSGNPGSFREVVGADPGINLFDHHGGESTGPVLTDPSCETFNEGYPEPGHKNAIPSGSRIASGQCVYEWTQHHEFGREYDNYNLYNSISVDANEWLTVGAEARNNYYTQTGRGLPISSNGGNDRALSLIKADHPANPYGVDVTPYSWHVFGRAMTTSPSHLHRDGDLVNRHSNNRQALNQWKLSADYDIAGSWIGRSTYSRQNNYAMSDQHRIDTSKLQLALRGQGGPNGDQYFNPFGSADPRSPYFEAGVTDNSQEITDWLWYHNSGFRSSENLLEVFETMVSGDVYDLPTGTVQVAVGHQWRQRTEEEFPEPHEAQVKGINYDATSYTSPRPEDRRYQSEVEAYFFEMQVPLWHTVDTQFAVRNERFKDFSLETTTPKVSIRWEALPSLSLRGSLGESFLAPGPKDARPFIPDESCGETYTGVDPISGTNLAGGLQCLGGNPSLQPETSTIKNLGFTWEPDGALTGIHLSMDYQEVEYEDRIRPLSHQDTVDYQFKQMLEATGLSEDNYDPTPGSATRQQADAWLQTLPEPGPGVNKVQRFSDGEVQKIFRQPANISSVWIDIIDLTAEYTFDAQSWGRFTGLLQASRYLTYEYEGLSGGVQDALGKQNSGSGIVPPLPETKGNLRLSWMRDNQSASLSANYWSSIDFDARIIDYYADRRQEPLTAPDELKGEYIVDARYSIILNEFNSEFTLSGGVNNLLDKRPQRFGNFGGFETRLSTPWGRQFYASVEWRPGL